MPPYRRADNPKLCAGFAAVRGLAAGMAVHVAAATAGLSALLASSAQVFGAVKLLGGLYLLWVGIAAIRRARRPNEEEAPPRRAGSWTAIGSRDGFSGSAVIPERQPVGMKGTHALLLSA